jgi:uncharacterized protein DUF11
VRDSSSTRIAQCNLGSLAFLAAATVTIEVRTTTRGAMANLAFAVANQPDPVPANNSAVAVTTVT